MTEDDFDSKEFLLFKARQAREHHTYAPFSGYTVGAAVRIEDNSVYVGGNVEMKPSTQTVHAEQNAVGKALSAGESSFERLALAVANDQPPCGNCLQSLATLEPELDAEILVYNTETDEVTEYTLEECLPHAYTPSVRHNEEDLDI